MKILGTKGLNVMSVHYSSPLPNAHLPSPQNTFLTKISAIATQLDQQVTFTRIKLNPHSDRPFPFHRKNSSIANINGRVKTVVNNCVSVFVFWENLSRIYLVVKLTSVRFFSFYSTSYSYPITFVNAFLQLQWQRVYGPAQCNCFVVQWKRIRVQNTKRICSSLGLFLRKKVSLVTHIFSYRV